MFKKYFLSVIFCVLAFSIYAAAQKSDIRKIDFNNYTYQLTDLSGEGKMTVTVKDGKFSRENEDDPLYFVVTNIEFGDLNGDAADEAIIITMMNTGGTGNFTNGLVFTMKNGKPVELTEFEGGDRADGGLVSGKVSDGFLVVERNSAGESGGACCPEFIETSRYKLTGATLAQVGKTISRELYPAERLSFEKGKSTGVYEQNIPGGELRRFVVGARKGQTLTISSNAKPADAVTYRLVKGDGVEDAMPNGLVIKLNSNGNFVFELFNIGEKDLNISMTVKIN